MQVSVLALDGVFDLGLAAVLDAFQTANELIEVAGLSVPRFELRVVGVRRAEGGRRQAALDEAVEALGVDARGGGLGAATSAVRGLGAR